MAKEHNIIISTSAQSDMEKIFNYIEQDNPRAAWLIRDKIYNKIKSLLYFSQKGRIVPELLDYNNIKEYRELQEYPWRIIYQASGGKITVHAVLDGRRNIKDLLLRKFL